MGEYTEMNQKAEYYGGACAAGCGLLVFIPIMILFIWAAFQ